VPIILTTELQPVSAADFASIDRDVMRCAYASQNYFGSLCDESVYESDIASRLEAESGYTISTQVPIEITHRDFSKTFFLDLVVSSIVYELKVVGKLSAAHRAQALNYAALLGTERIKLLNFGCDSVQGELIGTPFRQTDRRDLNVDLDGFQAVGSECRGFCELAVDLVQDLGGYLSASVYRDALIHLHGGEVECVRRLLLCRDGLDVGSQRTLLCGDGCAFTVSAHGARRSAHEKQLRTLTRLLPVRCVHWVNIHHRQFTIKTLI
jgi:GxxExxY protein